MQIEIIKTGAVVAERDFYEMHPTIGFPQPLTDEALADFGALLVVPSPPEPPTQFELDQARYQKRSAAKNDLLAYMAADNMGRVRSGAWSVPQLMSLMDDPAVSSANAYMSTLSFELAAQAIQAAATPLLTPAIRTDWVGRLQEHLYLEG